MEYLDWGMIFAIISTPILVYCWLTMKDGLNGELTNWWNGESYDGDYLTLEIVVVIFFSFTAFLIVMVGYPVLVGGAIITMMITSLRNKRLARINKQK